MSGAEEEALSPDEMRRRLYQTFKKKGFLDTLKTQLRHQLIRELKQPAAGAAMGAQPAVLGASNSLVVEHLRGCGYEYTLSVFCPEAGVAGDQVFPTRDLLQLMNVGPGSPLYKTLTSGLEKRSEKGFLMDLLAALAGHHLHKEGVDIDTQTNTSKAFKESLVEKMQAIDEEYELLRSRGSSWQSFESKLAEYRKGIVEQAQAELEAKLQHFKDAEISKVKMEEREKARKEILEARRDMERTYEMKSEALMSREKNAIDRLQKQQQIEEKEIYMQRQTLLKEIETARNRESELRQKGEAFEKTCKLQEEKNRTMEELLRRREVAVKTMEDTYDQKLKNELTRYQLELKDENVKRTEKLTEDEKRNQAETVRLQKEASALEVKQEEHRRACAEVKYLQVELSTTQSQNSLLSQQNHLLRDKLETVSDYPALKKEKAELLSLIRLLKTQLEEAQEENQHLRQAALSQPSQEHLALQSELNRLELDWKLQKEEFENQKRVLQTQLQHEVEGAGQLKAQLLECEERTRWMTAHSEEMKMRLQLTQQALENEVLRNPKPSLVDRSVLHRSADKMVPPDLYIDGAILRGQAGYGDVCEAGMSARGIRHHRTHCASPDSDVELMAGARARIQELEKEADMLEEAYRKYQQRDVRSIVSHILPEKLQPPLQLPGHGATRLPAAAQHRDQPRRVTTEHIARDLILQPYVFNTEAGLAAEPSSSPLPRRLSSTPLSLSPTLPKAEAVKDTLPASFAVLYPERQISPIPGPTIPSRDHSALLSPPRSPKSATRDHASLLQVQQEIPSLDSSPQPDKIAIEDLAEPSPEPSRIPEPLQAEGIHLCEEATEGLAVPPPGIQSSVPETDEEEDLRWELERKRREEKRQQERLEAQERELRELERLELERQLEELDKENKEKELEVEVEVLSAGQEGQEEGGQQAQLEKEPSSETNPLQRYMRMVLQGAETEREQSPRKEETDHSSPGVQVLSDKDDSIAAFSHEADDDFW
ncbi:centriole and centriolar satellite protein ofd1 isoform X3 [Denticeps clupeoides]|uniref:centriole and centriolar satellite protein ofd1 isoform X3 n=1 Tax=Denticeps clupeoides TaxID=299321 RepID=UPI0010A43BC1|nr:oral-facial-digital syndrome 1 protein isoform X3 [Denticeps clupeoides]